MLNIGNMAQDNWNTFHQNVYSIQLNRTPISHNRVLTEDFFPESDQRGCHLTVVGCVWGEKIIHLPSSSCEIVQIIQSIHQLHT